MPITERQTVVVAALTYKRIEMLAQLLESLLTLERPAGWDLRFLIVDNDPQASAKATVEALAARFEGAMDYVVEPEPGIPAARNRALREAATIGARFLAFIDDDSYPDAAWLRMLLAHQAQTGAVLVGGPYITKLPTRPLTRWQQFLARSLVARGRFMARNAARHDREGAFIVVSSGNWLADLHWLADRNIWFDPAYRESGGSDVAISLAIRSKGGKVSWCPTAIIYEHLPPERLSVRSQFTRHRHQGILMARLHPVSRGEMLLIQPARAIAGVGLILLPIFGRASFMVGVYLIAMAIGKISSLSGAKSRLYARE